MISKAVLGTIAKDQLRDFNRLEDTVQRELLTRIASYEGSAAFVVKGVRRCGKSTLLKQIMKSKFEEDFYYFNFDDERIANFKAEDFQSLMEVLLEQFGKKKSVFFDEIQNVLEWELFINRMLREGYRVFITGSNASLLSKELGTRLTGRHIDIELYPFSFLEFLRAKKIVLKGGYYSTEEKALLSGKFKEYVEKGGMPEVVVFSNELILTHVLTDIVQRDIANRYKIRDVNGLRMIVNFLIANSANLITYKSLKDNFGIKSAGTIQKYVRYLEEAYVIFTIPKFDKKIKQFDKNPKKVYCIDNGIITRNAPSINERNGVLLENLIAIQLKRLGRDFFYYKSAGGVEADFVVPSNKTIIQACYELTDGNSEREIKGLLEAAEKIDGARLLIITNDQDKTITSNGNKITVKSAWQWLIESEGKK